MKVEAREMSHSHFAVDACSLPDGRSHGGHEPVEPDLHLALAEAVDVELDVLAVLGGHGVGRVGQSLRVLLPSLHGDRLLGVLWTQVQLGHRVKQLGQVLGYLKMSDKKVVHQGLILKISIIVYVYLLNFPSI